MHVTSGFPFWEDSTWEWELDDAAASPTEMFADRDYGGIDLAKLTVGGYGYRWICLRREFSL
jgi:hypothetical protein